MELCRKMDTSHYYAGINSRTVSSKPISSSAIVTETGEMPAIPFLGQRLQPPPSQEVPFQHGYDFASADGQWDAGLECKQDLDALYKDNGDDYGSHLQSSAYSNMMSPYYSNFGNSSNSTSNNHSGNGGAYQITSSASTPLTTWYNPPSAPSPHHYHPSVYAQQYQPNYLSSSSATSPSPGTPMSPPEHMMNMIHLTNR